MRPVDERTEPTDFELMGRIAVGDADAFDALFLRHRGAVYGFTLRMVSGDVSLAEDLTQECFLRVWRTRPGFRAGMAAVRTYLLTIARHLCLDERKRRQITTVPLCLEDTEASHPPVCAAQAVGASWSGSGPERTLLIRELAAMLEAAIRGLPAEQREAVLLRDVEGLSYLEIACITESPLGTVKSRLNAGRGRLRSVLLEYLEERSR